MFPRRMVAGMAALCIASFVKADQAGPNLWTVPVVNAAYNQPAGFDQTFLNLPNGEYDLNFTIAPIGGMPNGLFYIMQNGYFLLFWNMTTVIPQPTRYSLSVEPNDIYYNQNIAFFKISNYFTVSDVTFYLTNAPPHPLRATALPENGGTLLFLALGVIATVMARKRIRGAMALG